MKKLNQTNKPVIKEQPKSELVLHPKSGAISGSVFEKQIDGKYGKMNIYSFNIEKSYPVKDNNGKILEWKYTSSFNKTDITQIEVILAEIKRNLYLDNDDEQDNEDSEIKEDTVE